MRRSFLLASILSLASCAPNASTSPASSFVPDQRTRLTIAIQPEDASLRYDRDDWPHWDDVPGTCYDIRAAVLMAESLRPTKFRDSSCTIDSGLWVSPYSGDTLQVASALQIDHLVPLHEAHLSGGATWDASRKRAFANDTTDAYHLLAVEGSINESKGDQDPAEWLPAPSFRCTYLAAWATIKARWNLAMDSAEYRTTRDGLDSCAEAGTTGMPRI